MRVLQNVHCAGDLSTEAEKQKAIKDGMWVTLVKHSTKDELNTYVTKSKKASSALQKGVQKPDDKSVEQKKWVKSLEFLFKGSLVTQKKYQAIRNSQVLDEYKLLPYRKLILKIARRHN